MPEEVQSRFTVKERPDAPPGSCVVCGATQRPVVDFGVDIEWADLPTNSQHFGRALFCESCIKQAASKFPDETSSAQALDYVPREELEQFKKELAEDAAEFIRSYDASVTSAGTLYGDADSVSEQAEPENTDEPERKLPNKSKTSRRLAVETTGTSGSQGSDGVPGNSGSGESSILE